MSDDRRQQADELLALSSIYDENVLTLCSPDGASNEVDDQCGVLRISVDVPEQFRVSSSEDSGLVHVVEHLPPILLKFTLPLDYPSTNSPRFTLACIWLNDTQIEVLSSELKRLWSENCGSVILFTWTCFLQTSSITTLSLLPSSSDSSFPLLPSVLHLVVLHDRTEHDARFASALFMCLICLREKQGSVSMRFSECDHVFCRDCLREYFECHIADGSVRKLNCPYEKCTTQAYPAEVKSLVSREAFDRYERLLLQSTLDSMTDILYCPRKDCATPVLIDHGGCMGSCPLCNYVFCIYCKRAYHYLEPCRLTTGDAQKLRLEYIAATEADKAVLDKRYGKKFLQRLVEEGFSAEWLESNSKKCPACSAQIQKIDGCNKMICSKCNAYFCWICLAVIPHINPYDHFNNLTSKCYNKLFAGVDVNHEADSDDDDFQL